MAPNSVLEVAVSACTAVGFVIDESRNSCPRLKTALPYPPYIDVAGGEHID